MVEHVSVTRLERVVVGDRPFQGVDLSLEPAGIVVVPPRCDVGVSARAVAVGFELPDLTIVGVGALRGLRPGAGYRGQLVAGGVAVAGSSGGRSGGSKTPGTVVSIARHQTIAGVVLLAGQRRAVPVLRFRPAGAPVCNILESAPLIIRIERGQGGRAGECRVVVVERSPTDQHSADQSIFLGGAIGMSGANPVTPQRGVELHGVGGCIAVNIEGDRFR